MTALAHIAPQRAETPRDPAERALRAMEANNLMIGQLCVNMIEGRDPFDGLNAEWEG